MKPKPTKSTAYVFAAIITLAGFAFVLGATAEPPIQVGPHPAGGYVVSTKQLLHPAGQSVEIHGRPVDMILSTDGRWLYIRDNRGLVVVDAVNWKVHQEVKCPEGGAIHGLAVTRDGTHLYISTARDVIWEVSVDPDGTANPSRKITVPGSTGGPEPKMCICGIALSEDEKTAYACLSRNNSLGVIDLATGKLVNEIATGIAPFGVVLSPDKSRAYVSNWGGRRPKAGERTASSSQSQALVDERGVVNSGTVSVLDLKQGTPMAEIETGLHPSGIDLSTDGRTLYVASANSDTVSVIDTTSNKVTETMSVRPDASLPFGSAPNALVLSKDGKTLYAANGGNNAVAAIALRSGNQGRSELRGFIPTAWYPGALATDGKYLYVANIKGLGSRGKLDGAKGWGIFDYLGTVNRVAFPSDDELKTYTKQVKADGRVPEILRAFEKAGTGKKPVPVPERTGEPSVFEHVVYIIKENKTYDQVFGDLPKGNNDPNLCIYPRQVTPNHHALAEQFVQLDNYYCNGVCSADGHAWVTQGDAVDTLERSFDAWTRSYPFGGDDCLSFCSSGFIWNNVLEHGLSFRNYGEMTFPLVLPGESWKSIYDAYTKNGASKLFLQYAPNRSLGLYSCLKYPGWSLDIPDVLRADIFLNEFRNYEKKGEWPSLITIYLPNDHTSGGNPGFPTPRAQVADNDLALGRVVEAISKSRFWPKTCIFVEEDDPQSGFDHVDGHRSPCLVISPYTKRGALISQFYNQTSVLHTMERMLGIPPMNQMDAMAPVMTECFTNKPDRRPYKCLPNQIPLDEMSLETGYHYGNDSTVASGDPFARPDTVNDDELNRTIWYLAKGPDAPYPAHLSGAHGRGLKALGLKLALDSED